MTQEEKKLLLKDLCARLPYGVKVQTPVMNDKITLTCGDISAYFFNPDNKVFPKPFLRPMSSMTEEERHTFDTITRGYTIHQQASLFDWLNAHHFDFRNLIERELAIDCTGLNVY